MNIKSIFILLLFVIWSLLCWKRYICHLKGFCDDTNAESSIMHPASDTYAIQSIPNSDSIIIGADFERFRDSICLAKRQGELRIIGNYYEGEINNTNLENLGIARAYRFIELIHTCIDSSVQISLGSNMIGKGSPTNSFQSVMIDNNSAHIIETASNSNSEK